MLFVLACACLFADGDVEPPKEIPKQVEALLFKEDIKRKDIRDKIRDEFLKKVVEVKPAERAALLTEFQHQADLENLKVRVELSSPLQVGDFGFCSLSSTVLQVVDDETYLISVVGTVYLVKGFPTKDFADDEFRPLRALVRVTGTESYTTVLGAKKTVKVIERFDEKELAAHRETWRKRKPLSLATIEIPANIDQLYAKFLREKKAAAKKKKNQSQDN